MAESWLDPGGISRDRGAVLAAGPAANGACLQWSCVDGEVHCPMAANSVRPG